MSSNIAIKSGHGPIQICNSRFAKCNLNTKSNYNNGNIINQSHTKLQRHTQLILVQSTMRNAHIVFQNVSLNGYGQKSGGPYGYGSSPKNTF